MSDRKKVGIFLFPNMTMIDAYAPLQFFSFVEEFETFTFSKTGEPVTSDSRALLTPDYGFATAPEIDILVVPGGGNVLDQMLDKDVISFIQKTGETAEYITSVCTGSLILAEAGLLNGHKSAVHWGYAEAMKGYPEVELVDERVCISGNRITGGGMTAGLDFALALIAEVVAIPTAQVLQLIFEYCPAPPFESGSPRTAPEFAVNAVRENIGALAADLFEYTNKRQL